MPVRISQNLTHKLDIYTRYIHSIYTREPHRAGHAECVEELLAHDADPTVLDALGRSAVHWACENGSDEIVKLLVQEEGVDYLTKRDKRGMTAMDLVRRRSKLQ